VSLSEDPFVRQVKPLSVVEQVIAEIRRSIVFGALKPGQEFSLRETAAHLGVSTAPVREALRVLQGEGLILVRRARSAVVAPMDRDDLASIYRLRRQIEPDLAVRSSGLITKASLANLDAIVATFGSDELGMSEIYDAHRDFHLELLKPAATPWDLRILETLWHAAERYVRVGFGRLDPDPAEHRRRGDAHHGLVEAFRSGDGEQVRLALVAHLDGNERLAREALNFA